MGEADRYDPNIIFNITSEDKEVSQQYLTPWTHSELRDLLIIPLLAISFLWTCGVLYLLVARRSSPFNTMWPSRALLVLVAFGWQASFAITTGRAQMTAFGISSQEQCRLFIFADFAVFEPWFCLILVFSLNIRWPTCLSSILRRCACCYSRRSGWTRADLEEHATTDLIGVGGGRDRSEDAGESHVVQVDVGAQRRGAPGQRAAAGADTEHEHGQGGSLAAAGRHACGAEGFGSEAAARAARRGGGDARRGDAALRPSAGDLSVSRHRRPALTTIEKEGAAGGLYYLAPTVSIVASVLLLAPSIFFHLAWYRLVVLGKEWPPMRLQVGGACATWLGHLLGTGVYLALAILMLHLNGRTLASLAINRRVQRRLLRLRVWLSTLLVTSFLLRFITVFYKDLSRSTNDTLFLAYFGVVILICNLSIYALVLRPLFGTLQPWAWAAQSHMH